ncbi:MAG: hypothetical protein H8E17_15450 [Deltaproteobacteria bacterium]|nr:hypothetical protein [Deltaproteobacteria bacterium]
MAQRKHKNESGVFFGTLDQKGDHCKTIITLGILGHYKKSIADRPVECQKTDTKTAHIRGKTAHTGYPDSQGQSLNVNKRGNRERKIEVCKSLPENKYRH